MCTADGQTEVVGEDKYLTRINSTHAEGFGRATLKKWTEFLVGPSRRFSNFSCCAPIVSN